MLAASPIPNLITERAEGVFMWARLVVDKAMRLDNEGQVLKRIEDAVYDIPPDLDELYLGLVRSMGKKSTSLKLIQWVCFATRPLSLDELRWAMLVDPDDPRQSLHEYQADDYPSDHDGMERRIQTLSCGLVEVTSSASLIFSYLNDFEDPEPDRVQFIHQSVKDFFVEKGLSALNGGLSISLTTVIWSMAAVFLHYFPRNLLSIQVFHLPITFAISAFWKHGVLTGTAKPDIVVGIAHHRLSRICLRYLAMEELGQTISDDFYSLDFEFPFLHYATTSWVAHTKQSHVSGVRQEDIVEYFARPSNELMERWVRNYNILEEDLHDCPPQQTSLIHVMSSHGVAGALWALLAKGDQVGVNIDEMDSDGQTPLSRAAAGGHEAVVQLLLDRGADIEAVDIEGWTPLWRAVENGHEAVVRLLLSRDRIGANAQHKHGWIPLSWALFHSREAVFQLLLTKNGIADVKDNNGRTLLMWAAENGEDMVVETLLAKGANLELRDKNGRTALFLAVLNRREGVIRQLLKKGADVEAKNNNGWTPLDWASVFKLDTIMWQLVCKTATSG
ncbi:hypothetical protein ACHAPJ_009600 [Fusarium lateritium]